MLLCCGYRCLAFAPDISGPFTTSRLTSSAPLSKVSSPVYPARPCCVMYTLWRVDQDSYTRGNDTHDELWQSAAERHVIFSYNGNLTFKELERVSQA